MNWITTTKDVYNAIRNAHDELVVHSCYTHMEGSAHDPRKGEIYTEFGFNGAIFPLIRAYTSWEIDPDNRNARINETTEYDIYATR